MSNGDTRTLQKTKTVGQKKQEPAEQGPMFNWGQVLQLLGQQQQAGQLNMAGMMRDMDKSRPRQGVAGEVRGQGLGDPAKTGLTGYYNQINPQMRPGEFDPTGRIANQRRSQGYAREDQLGTLNFRNEFAQGLMDLNRKMQKIQGGADEFGAVGPRELSVFDPLFSQSTRTDRLQW